MRFRLLIISVFITFSMGKAICQQGEFYFSGKYDRTPFEIFTREIEGQLPVHFMYHPEMVAHIFVTANYNHTSLSQALNQLFVNTDLHFYINDNNQVILSEGIEIKPGLPDDFFKWSGQVNETDQNRGFLFCLAKVG